MAVIKRTSFAENIDKYNTFVQDTNPNSTYFNVTELPQSFTGGKNAFLIAGSNELVADTLIKIEIKDAAGNIIYHEPGEGRLLTTLNEEPIENEYTEYYEGVSKVVAVYVYPDTTAYGPCTITILGELSSYYDDNGLLTPIPIDLQGIYNVKWQRSINVNPTLANTTKIRFYRRPTVGITEILSPIFRIENGLKVNSGINQSFAEIKLSQLETFAGDVKRVKVFRTSEGDISDFDLIQDILVESKELLTTTQLTGSVIGNTGTFTSEILPLFWNTSSLTVELTSSRVESGVALNGSGYFTHSSSLDIKSANTYELSLDSFYSASTDSNLGIYLSQVTTSVINGVTTSTTISSSIATLIGTQPTKNLLDTVIPFKIDRNFPDAKLYFSQSQGEWHLGNISLRLSEDTAFSPDEVSFITTMPSVIGNETFNFKFEFYDVNNNFVPVLVTGSANFTGGSNTITKLLTFESDRTAFRFSTGSFANPANQSVSFKTKKTNFTGSIIYASSAFDVGGTYIQPASYAGTYPGAFVSQNDNGALLNISSFIGSVTSVLVGSIVYTASCEGFTEFETIYRFEDGDNAPGVFVTANTNQFIYKATDLSLNPSGQIITIEAKRKNLASATTPLIVNSGSGKPPLIFVSTNATNGVDTYTIAGTNYPFTTGETTYFISGSDQFGNEFSDAIKITPVKILDGLSATLTNDNVSLPALSNGFVASGSFIFASGSINVKVGNETIVFDDDNDGSRINNTFAITNVSGVGCTPNSTNPSDNAYSITSLSTDSGSLDITIDYKDGAGDTTSLIKSVTYTKNKKAAPVLSFVIGNNNQTVTAKSTGVQIDTFVNPTFVVNEAYNGVTTTKTFTPISVIATNSYTGFNATATSLTLPNMANGTDSVDISVTGSVVDSENITRNVFGNISLAKTKKAAPVLAISSTPKDQSVTAKSTGVQIDSFANATIVVKETYNGVTNILPATLTAIRVDTGGSLTVNNTTGLVTLTNQTLAAGVNSTTVNISAVVTDSEGTSRTLTDTLSLSKVKKAVPLVLVSASPQAQSVLANAAGVQTGTLSNVTITALEGTSRFTSMNIASTSGFSTLPTVSGTSNILTMTSAVMNAAEASVTLTITHTDSEGTGGQTQTIIVRTTKVPTGAAGANGTNGTNGTDGTNGTNGQTGPGVVHTGVWASGRTYQFANGLLDTANGATGRRDTVLWSTTGNAPYNTYYAATRRHTSATGNVADGAPHQSNQTCWISLGAQDFFVAAKIGIFEDSFVQNTLNIGTNSNGALAAANITLAGGSAYPYISIGQSASAGSQGYNVNGIFMGVVNVSNAPVYRLSLKSATNSLNWDGTNLAINGGGTFTGALSAATGTFSGALSAATGTFSGALSGGTISIGNGNSIFKADGNGIYLGHATFASAPFRVTPGGAITATDATITGAIASSTITGTNIAGGTITGGTITGGTLTGAIITAGAGVIGGWTINQTTLSSNSNSIKLNPSATTPGLEIYDTSGVLRVLVSNQPTLTDFTVGNPAITPSGTPQSTANQQILTASNPNSTTLNVSLSTPLFNFTSVPAAAITNAGVYNLDLTISQAQLAAVSAYIIQAQQNPEVRLNFVNTQVTAGISVRAGSSTGTEVANFGSSFGGIEALNTVSYNNNTGVYNTAGQGTTRTFSSTFTATASTTYFFVPYISSGFSVVARDYFGDITDFDLYVAFNTPKVDSIVISRDNNRVEVIPGGLQVVASSSRFFKVARTVQETFVEIGGALTATGNITAFSSSDKRLKENIIPIGNALDKIEKLDGVEFDWTDEYILRESNGEGEDNYFFRKHDVGLIAQQVQEILPEVVATRDDGYLAIKYEKIVPLLVECIKELKKEINELKENK